jgi:predicted ATPase
MSRRPARFLQENFARRKLGSPFSYGKLLRQTMIKLTVQKPHRSISHLPETELPDFAIITGINGSGKTHLLEAIEQGAVQIDGVQSGHNRIRRYDWLSLAPQIGANANPLQQRQAFDQAIEQARKNLNNHRDAVIRWVDQQKIEGNAIFRDPNWLFSTSQQDFEKEVAKATVYGNPVDEKRAKTFAESFLRQRQTREKGFLGSIANFGSLSSALVGKAKEANQFVLALTDADIEQQMPLILTAGSCCTFAWLLLALAATRFSC